MSSLTDRKFWMRFECRTLSSFTSDRHNKPTLHFSANFYRENKQIVTVCVLEAGTFYFILSPRLNICLLRGFLFWLVALFTDQRFLPTIPYVFGHPRYRKACNDRYSAPRSIFRTILIVFAPLLAHFSALLCSENMFTFATNLCTFAPFLRYTSQMVLNVVVSGF